MKKWIKKLRKPFAIGMAVVAVVILASMAVVPIFDQSGAIQTIGVGQKVITIGHVAYAAGTADYTCDGVADNVQVQAAMDALPATGGQLIILAGNYAFAATVTRAITNVTVTGTGQATYIANDGITALFTAGGNNWVFNNIETDAGSINMGATTEWMWTNVDDGTFYAYRGPYGQSAVNLLTIPNTTSAAVGVISKGADRFIHNYADATADGFNTFVGIDAGNFTMSPGGGAATLSSTNTGIGYGALSSLTDGYRNTSIGYLAGGNQTDTVANTLVGWLAGRDITTGNNNTGIGGTTLSELTTGVNNTAVGYDAMWQCDVAASYNVAVGHTSLQRVESQSNVGVGNSTLISLTTGGFNTAVGDASLVSLVAGDFNVAVGRYAGEQETGSNNTFVGFASGGYGADTNRTGSVHLGYFAGHYETLSDKLFIDNRNRTNEATARVASLIYGEFSATVASQTVYINGNLYVRHTLGYGAEDEVTIDGGGAIAVTDSYHSVIVNGGTGSGNDALTSATGGTEGQYLILKSNTSGGADTVTVTDGAGANAFILEGGVNFTLDHIDDRIILLGNGTEWVETSRSNNS